MMIHSRVNEKLLRIIYTCAIIGGSSLDKRPKRKLYHVIDRTGTPLRYSLLFV